MCELCESVYRPGDRFADFWRRLQRRHEERCEALRVSWLLDFQNGFLGGDLNEDEEDVATDEAGWPIRFYERRFQHAVIAVALALGWYDSPRQALLYRSLDDRYLRRGEWTMEILLAAFVDPDLPPAPTADHARQWYDSRAGLPAAAARQMRRGQLSLFSVT